MNLCTLYDGIDYCGFQYCANNLLTTTSQVLVHSTGTTRHNGRIVCEQTLCCLSLCEFDLP